MGDILKPSSHRLFMNKRGSGSNVIDISARMPASKAFKSVGVLLSAIESGSITPDDKKMLLGKIREKINTLEAELAGDGKGLGARVQSYLRTMAGGREDELSGSGVDFRVPQRKLEINLAAGEAEKKSSTKKIERIISECKTLAQEDLVFLEKTLKKLRSSELDPPEISQLKSILGNNTYWRYLEAN
jgi:hypothetical protein